MRLALPLAFLCAALLCLLQLVSVSAQENGYAYTVQPGDSWSLVARRVGLTARALQEANPDAMRPNGWLIVGERLFIPRAPDWEEKFYIIQRGDGWITVADKFGLPVELLRAANPQAQRQDESLIVGERLLIPDLPPTSTPEARFDFVTIISAAEEAAPFSTPRAGDRRPALATLPPCPDAPNDMDQTLTALFGTPTSDRYAQLTAFLAGCGAELRLLVNADLNADRVEDAALVYKTAARDKAVSDPLPARGAQQELLILSGGEAYALRYAATAVGNIELLATQDINADNQTDVVWTDTACGANACFVTVHVRSWDGAGWRDWTKGTITMASAIVSLTPGGKPGSPMEIRLTGGKYTNANAGPQRARTVVWTSADGAPYAVSSEKLAPSACLYHTVLDANRALADERDLKKARRLYTDAVENEELQACGIRRNELSELRSFALFRLALIAGYMSDAELAASYAQRLASMYGGQIYTKVALRWLTAYRQDGDPQTACEAVYDFAAATPTVLDVLADYGYANPSFTAEDVCPSPVDSG